jgi:hypothetical protein
MSTTAYTLLFPVTKHLQKIDMLYLKVHGSVVGWGTMLQAGLIPDDVTGFFPFT